MRGYGPAAADFDGIDRHIQETGAEVVTLHSIQNVSLAEFEAGETYVSIMQKNADALEKGLN